MAQVDAGLAVVSRYRLLEQGGDPANPAAGYGYLYCKPEGVFFKQDDGVVVGPFGFGIVPGGRLTLETGVPVSTSDQSAKATLYYTPYQHNVIPLYSNSKWNPVEFTEKSITLIGLIASRLYDVWGYLSGGTLALELLAWTNGTTRATALARQDGMYIKSGDATRRYLGTIYTNSGGGQTEDTEAQRFVWNYYNRVSKNLLIIDNTSHTYATPTWRYWNNDSSQIVEYVVGVPEDVFIYSAWGSMHSTAYVGAGINTAITADIHVKVSEIGTTDRIGTSEPRIATLGYSFVAIVELGNANPATYDDARVSVTLWS